MEQLEIRNLSLQIGEVPVLRDFSCKIDMGESLTIIGESGSGKPSWQNYWLVIFHKV